MRKIVNILLGWWFWVTNQNNLMAAERLQICAECSYRKGMVCSVCGCVLQAKARLLEEECPILRWQPYFKWYYKQVEKYKKIKK